ncbi:DEAD/DEAH box helicase family protein [Chloroflexota bacterium]
MSLKEITFQEDYRTGQDDILNSLFRSSLREATSYWRAVGYFSSSALEAFGEPLDEFVKRNGSIKLITSVELTEDDYAAIEKGLSHQEVSESRIEQIIDEEFVAGIGNGVSRLAALLEIGRLEIQIAIPKKGRGIYHEKVGVFFDGEEYVAFSGSSNESKNAFENNYECIDVYPSWEIPSRALRKRRHFMDLWENNDPGAEVFPFPEAAKRKLIRINKSQGKGPSKSKVEDDQEGQDEDTKNKWRHQDKAVSEFLKYERGVLNMATGTGKTRTALKIITELFRRDLIDTIIISTDGTDLLDQWYREILLWREHIPEGLVAYRHYSSFHGTEDYALEPRGAILLASRLQLSRALTGISDTIGYRMLLVHDEVHRLGSTGNIHNLAGQSDNIRFRLGLSATPEREYDQEGNEFIEKHIGPVIYEFDLKEAVKRGILTGFNYHPLTYVLTEEDKKRVTAVYARQKARAEEGNPMSPEEIATAIAFVYKTSPAKIPIFDDYIKTHPNLLKRCIVFVETMEYGEDILQLIHNYRPDFHTYYSGEDSATLNRFARGELECLITCHRLSEGIDIQSLNTVILFSATRGRLETIQRMGRCLRVNPLDQDKIADIIDFIRKDNLPGEPNTDELRRDWLVDLSKTQREE